MEDTPIAAANILAALEEMKRLSAPVGIGPVANADVYGEMIRPKATGSIPYDTGAPIQEMVHTPVEPDAGEIVPASYSREVAGIGLNQQDTDLPGGGLGLSKRQVPQQVKKESAPEQESAKQAIQEMPDIPQEMKDEAKAHVDNPTIMEKPREEMSSMEKLALIAMAIAPAVVGYAAHGKKGAYLGAASSGKGLAAGLEYDMEQKRMQAKRPTKADTLLKAGKPGGETEDELGFVYKYDAQGQPQPVMLPSGKQLRRANVTTTTLTPAGETITRQKYEGGKEEPVPEAAVSSLSTIGGRIRNILDQSREKYPDLVIAVPEEFSAYQQMNPDDPKTQKQLRERYYRWEKQANERIQKYADAVSAQKGKPSVAKTAGVAQDRAGDSRYARSIEDGIIKPKFVPLEALKSRTNFYLDQANTKMKNVFDPMMWQGYLKTIQGDESVIRPGENEMALQFMPLQTKIEGLINRNVKLDSIMTDELRKDIINMFKNMRKIRERDFVDSVNEEIINSRMIGKENVLNQRLPGSAKTIVKDYAITNNKFKQPITVDEVKSKISSGELQSGDLFTGTDGKIRFVRTTAPIKIVPWRLSK